MWEITVVTLIVLLVIIFFLISRIQRLKKTQKWSVQTITTFCVLVSDIKNFCPDYLSTKIEELRRRLSEAPGSDKFYYGWSALENLKSQLGYRSDSIATMLKVATLATKYREISEEDFKKSRAEIVAYFEKINMEPPTDFLDAIEALRKKSCHRKKAIEIRKRLSPKNPHWLDEPFWDLTSEMFDHAKVAGLEPGDEGWFAEKTDIDNFPSEVRRRYSYHFREHGMMSPAYLAYCAIEGTLPRNAPEALRDLPF